MPPGSPWHPGRFDGANSIVQRIFLVWGVPYFATIAGCPSRDNAWPASVVATVLEVALFLGPQSKDFRRAAAAIGRMVPFPVRFGILVAMQLWFLLVRMGTFVARDAADFVTNAAPADSFVAGNRRSVEARRGFASSDAHAAGSGVVVANSVGAGPKHIETFSSNLYPTMNSGAARWSPKTITVVLPCAGERDFAKKSVIAIHQATPGEVLKEIIVVDDGSEPPLEQTVLQPEVQAQYGVRILRIESTKGMINAKNVGASAASGDIIVVLDCHVSPQAEWYKPFLRLMGEDYRRVVVPKVTDLNHKTWEQYPPRASMSLQKCYLTWDADFKWFSTEDPFVPILAGSTMGISRRWWEETARFDEGMSGSYDNIEESLKVWLCGGEIVFANDSQVAHMWRKGDDPSTKAQYKIVGDARINRARAAYGWYGDFADKLNQYPFFASKAAKTGDSLPWYGSINKTLEVKERLKCRPFSWFLRRFKFVYEDGGIIPQEIFLLQESVSRRCLRYFGDSGNSVSGTGLAKLGPCELPADPSEEPQLYWHLANRKPRSLKGACCSGIRAWNTDQCLEKLEDGRFFKTGVCSIDGKHPFQAWTITKNGELRCSYTGQCVGVDGAGELVLRPCDQLRSSTQKWVMYAKTMPIEARLYNRDRQALPQVFAELDAYLASSQRNPLKETCGSVEGGCVHLFRKGSRAECLDSGIQFSLDLSDCHAFYYERGDLRSVVDTGKCLDVMNDQNYETWGVYNCHGGQNQKYEKNSKSGTYCNIMSECLESSPVTNLEG